MPQLVWDPLDFLTVLAVEPVSPEEAYDRELRYFREAMPLWLEMTVWQDESRVAVSVGVSGRDQPKSRHRLH